MVSYPEYIKPVYHSILKFYHVVKLICKSKSHLHSNRFNILQYKQVCNLHSIMTILQQLKQIVRLCIINQLSARRTALVHHGLPLIWGNKILQLQMLQCIVIRLHTVFTLKHMHTEDKFAMNKHSLSQDMIVTTIQYR